MQIDHIKDILVLGAVIEKANQDDELEKYVSFLNDPKCSWVTHPKVNKWLSVHPDSKE